MRWRSSPARSPRAWLCGKPRRRERSAADARQALRHEAVRMPHIIIAGGGVAGLEALLALRAMAGERVRLTLVAPEPDFTYKPLAVAAPFGLGHERGVPLARFTEAARAELVLDAIEEVDDAFGRVRLAGGGTLYYDQLIVATGGRPVAGLEGAVTWWPGTNPETYGGL